MRNAKTLRTLRDRLAQQLAQRGSPEHQKHTAAEVLRATEVTIARIRTLKDAASRRWRMQFTRWYQTDPPEGPPQALEPETTHATLARWGAWSALVAEIILTWWMMPVYVLNASADLYIGFAVLLAALGMGAAGAAAVRLARWSETPAPAKHWLTRWICGVGAITGILFGLVFLTRAAAGPLAWLSPWFPPAAATLAGIVVLFSGLLHTAAHFYGWSRREAAAWEALDSLEAELLLHATEAALRRDRPMTAAAPLRSGLTAAALLLLLASQAQGQGFVRLDVTASMDSVSPANRTQVLQIVRATIRELGTRGPIRRWEVQPFSDDGFDLGPRWEVTWPAPPDSICSPPAFTEVEQLLAQPHADRVRRAENACDVKRRNTRRAYAQAVVEADASLDSAFRAAAATKPGRCTGLRDVFSRLRYLRPGSLALVITDGRQTCRDVVAPVQAPRPGVMVVVVLISPKGHTASDFEDRTKALHRMAPWSRVVPPWALDPEYVATLVGTPPLSERFQ